MNHHEHLAIIGSGASSIYLLKHLLDQAPLLRWQVCKISIFEKSSITGMGMPYSPKTTDVFNMSNISSEELPELPVTFGDWLRSQEPAVLKNLHLEGVTISDSEVYSRLALGRYLHAQYLTLIASLAECGIEILEHPGCEIIDVQDQPCGECVVLTTSQGAEHAFNRVIIATGHCWADDKPESGFYASPWPISKLLPREGEHHNHAIGTLGASLSAFDVITSLAHRHGDFVLHEKGKMTFRPHPGTENFQIIMHSGHGLLPHLQFDQEEPFREIYRHVDREGILSLINDQRFLRIHTFFEQVCRPALRKAFEKDSMPELVSLMDDSQFGLVEFVEKMTDKHDYSNAFDGMEQEMVEARNSVLNHKPVHWKEVIDDLMYTLNFHAELMPAEDHLLLHSKVMPFLMNVIAAMPLPSGNTILALHDAGKLEMVSGRVCIADNQTEQGMTKIIIDDEGVESSMSYRMFIDCSGQKPLELEDYPFPGLVKNGSVRKARAAFCDSKSVADSLPDEKKAHLFKDGDDLFYHIGGIDIDGTYRVIGRDGKPNSRIHDIAFPHTSGIRPYSYGLQACSDTSAILVRAWVEEIKGAAPVENDIVEITEIYEKVQAA
ncbi:FAD/NAD(P)-binding protein [Prosthecobacter sp.]|uniref:FAD/NAD(P)-binding protein n=1 Tax=Prosthecobacter sp. TaxID=1965333 RepID=UPI0024887D87|nr:FAD/NAD(P)-binding protein [Prosthecobacter sp.]MDI1312030.1 FAD/NAD(P)-binding protein [Prosthecobacter sp.]